jgi:hypothetical protein
MEDCFNEILGRQGSPPLAIDGVAALEFSPQTEHPVFGRQDVARAQFDRTGGTYRIRIPLRYVEWASMDWGVRVKEFADAMLAGIGALPRSRFNDGDRAILRAAVGRAAEAALSSKPEAVSAVKPIFVFTDAEGKAVSVSYDINDNTDPVPRVGFQIAPEDAGKHEGIWPDRQSKTSTDPFKLYRRVSPSELHYREAWYADGVVTEHWGRCGERGEAREHPARNETDVAIVLSRLKKSARDAGYRPIPESRMKFLIVEYALDSWGSPDDLARRHKLEDEFNDLIGWLGLGHLDGGSIGSGTMEVALVVVDFNIAKSALERETKGTEMDGFRRISRS